MYHTVMEIDFTLIFVNILYINRIIHFRLVNINPTWDYSNSTKYMNFDALEQT